MKKGIGILLLFSLLVTLGSPPNVQALTKYRIQGTVYYKDESPASGVKLELLENDVVLKSVKTDKGGKYRFDIELTENHDYTIKLSKDKIQTQLNEITTPDNTQNTIEKDYTVNKVPVADGGGDVSGFINKPVEFDSSGSSDEDLDPISFHWSFGDGGESDEPNPSHAYTAPGEYKVTLTIIDIDEAVDTDDVKCSIENMPPEIVLNGPYQTKEGTPITFSSTGTNDPDGEIVSYFWEFGDGGTSPETNPTHIYPIKGDYTVKLRVTDNYGEESQDSTLCVVTENKSPVANANGPYTCNALEEYQFDSTGSMDPDDSILSFHWDFGDGSENEEENPTHVYLLNGSFFITLTVIDPAGLTSVDTTTCMVLPPPPQPPVANTNGPYQGYLKQPVSFTSNGSFDPDGEIVEYHWDFGDSQFSNTASPSHIYLQEETYNVTLSVTDNSGLISWHQTICKIKSIPVITSTPILSNEKPIAEGNGPYTGYVDDPIWFSSESSYDHDGEITEYNWHFGDGSTSNEANPKHQYNSTGFYEVQMIVTDDRGKKDTYQTVCEVSQKNTPPIVSFDAQNIGKIEEPIQFYSRSFDPDGEIVEYYWQFGDGYTSKEASPIHDFSDPGNYSVSLTVTDNLHSVNHTVSNIQIANNNLPFAVIDGTDKIERGQRADFTAEYSYDIDGNIVEYLIDFGDSTFAYGPTASHIFPETGTYNITLTVIDDNQGTCTDSILCEVFNNAPPKIGSEGVFTGVEDKTVSFNIDIEDTDGQIAYVFWDFGDGSTSREKNPEHVYSDPGEYTVYLSATDNMNKETTKVLTAIISPGEEPNKPVLTSVVIFSLIVYLLKDRSKLLEHFQQIFT